LHPRDNRRLLDTLAALRDLGNTVVRRRTDEETIRRADLRGRPGPGAGTHGGTVVALGDPSDVANNPNSESPGFTFARTKDSGADGTRLPNGKRSSVRGAHHPI